MKNINDIINSELNTLKSKINEIIYDEISSLVIGIKQSLIYDEGKNFDSYMEKLKNIKSMQKDLLSRLAPYKNDDSNEDIFEDEDTIATSGSISYEDIELEEISTSPASYSTNPEDNYYFYNSNINYGEVDLSLNVTYNLKKLEDFNMFPLKISGIKLFDNIFLGRTFKESMIKMMSFLFSLNEAPFIKLCETDLKYFSNKSSSLKKPLVLKENKCYIESEIEETEAVEMIKIFLKHINIDISSCKVLMSCSINKKDESYVTIIL